MLYPPSSMVRNEGFDRSGACGSRSVSLWRRPSPTLPERVPNLPGEVELQTDALEYVARFVDPFGLRNLRRLVFRNSAPIGTRSAAGLE